MLYTRCYVALIIMNVRETVIEVLNILQEKQDSYIDPAKHIYDAEKMIKRHLDDEDLINLCLRVDVMTLSMKNTNVNMEWLN